MPETFFSEFEATLSVHVLKRWKNPDILHYMIGGEPILAREFACWLVCGRENAGVAQMGDQDSSRDEHVFSDLVIELDKFHITNSGPIKINVRECMTYLTTGEGGNIVDPAHILKDKFVLSHWSLIEELAIVDNSLPAVRLFDKKSDGELSRLKMAFACVATNYSNVPRPNRIYRQIDLG